MHADLEHRRIKLPSRGKSAQRKRRLSRGVARWNLDREQCAEPTRRIARVTLTLREPDPEAAIGRVYAFLAKVRRQWLGTRYFCWLELQARGAVHYHCIWLNPPHVKRVNLVSWVDKAWGDGRTQVRFSDGQHGLQRAMDYAVAHTKKMGRKAYQQKYDDVPRQLRTFMSQRLEIPNDKLDEHLDQDVYRYHAADVRQIAGAHGQTELRPAFLEYVGQLVHRVPIGGRCTAIDHRRPKRGPPLKSVPGRP